MGCKLDGPSSKERPKADSSAPYPALTALLGFRVEVVVLVVKATGHSLLGPSAKCKHQRTLARNCRECSSSSNWGRERNLDAWK